MDSALCVLGAVFFTFFDQKQPLLGVLASSFIPLLMGQGSPLFLQMHCLTRVVQVGLTQGHSRPKAV